jgi:hypothetical protein
LIGPLPQTYAAYVHIFPWYLKLTSIKQKERKEERKERHPVTKEIKKIMVV